jgi:hypothetical protein
MVFKATGWPLQTADVVGETQPPTAVEMRVLRSLRTAMPAGPMVGVA